MNRQNLYPILGLLIVIVGLVAANRRVFAVSSQHNVYDDASLPLPNTWPRSYPLYPNSTYQGSDKAQGQAHGKWYDKAWFSADGTSETIIRWYQAHLKKAGYRPISQTTTGFSRKYAFDTKRQVVDMEIFVGSDSPTEFSVDVLPTAAR